MIYEQLFSSASEHVFCESCRKEKSYNAFGIVNLDDFYSQVVVFLVGSVKMVSLYG
jgi:hypothetical protein